MALVLPARSCWDAFAGPTIPHVDRVFVYTGLLRSFDAEKRKWREQYLARYNVVDSFDLDVDGGCVFLHWPR